MREQEFIDRIIEAFQQLRERPNLGHVSDQFAAGEISFVVDRRGIRVVFEDDDEGVEPPGVL